VNTHPSLLPKYGGKGMFGSHIHKSVVRDKQKETGVTLHWVDQNYDTGGIIAQKVIPIFEGETSEQVEDRVKLIEKEFLIETLPKILNLN
jgi:phosphoribosylglycinamide formyltransferase-1